MFKAVARFLKFVVLVGAITKVIYLNANLEALVTKFSSFITMILSKKAAFNLDFTPVIACFQPNMPKIYENLPHGLEHLALVKTYFSLQYPHLLKHIMERLALLFSAVNIHQKSDNHFVRVYI